MFDSSSSRRGHFFMEPCVGFGYSVDESRREILCGLLRIEHFIEGAQSRGDRLSDASVELARRQHNSSSRVKNVTTQLSVSRSFLFEIQLLIEGVNITGCSRHRSSLLV